MSDSGRTMRAVVRRRNGAVHFVAETGNGGVVPIDGAPAIGGEGLGARPMELLLSALGGCAGIDVVGILAKQRQALDDLTVTVEGERAPGEPSLFTRIQVHFAATGPVDEAALRRAVELSMEKYCSVARVLEHTASITYSHAIAPAVAATQASRPL
ncbi:MAG TPA: OsmC family protein [Gemmatimonadales bacterium]|jgi:putative redox protein|nr:OsmC family protein [Gemmatimonadales bacterium]